MFKFENLNPLNAIRDTVNKKVNESLVPNENYKSTVGVYGGKMVMEEDGKMVWNNEGFISKIDKWGDAILRTYDDHLVKNMSNLFKNHPKLFFKFLAPGTKRYRGTKEEIFDNIERLGLEDTYGLHKNGIEIKNQDVYRQGILLQDIFRADLIDNDKIKDLDRFEALNKSGEYLRKIHDEHGGVGEVLTNDIIFLRSTNNEVEKPILNLPDIIFNKEKNIGDKEKKAIDVLDFISSVGAEEFRRSQGDLDSVKKSIETVLRGYDNQEVISLVKSYIKRGRLTLLGDADSEAVNIPSDTFTTKNRAIFTKHNEARVVNNKSLETILKDVSLEICDKVLKNN